MANSFFTEKFPLDKLKLYERNPRKISKKAIEVVAKSIRMNGALDPIEADEDGLILAGHTRYKAYKELGYIEVPVVQHTGMTAIQKRTYRIASNKTAEYSEWDDELLAAEMKDIDAEIDRVLAQDSTGISEIKDEEYYEGTNDTHASKIKEGKYINCPHCNEEIDISVYK